MKIDLSILVKNLNALPHTPAPKPKKVSQYVLTHILEPLKAGVHVSFAELDFEAFTEDDLDSLCQVLSEAEARQDGLVRLRSTFCASEPKAAARQKFC